MSNAQENFSSMPPHSSEDEERDREGHGHLGDHGDNMTNSETLCQKEDSENVSSISDYSHR
ncbi:hypothetical protein N7508_007638 [Penicillium antarcticum]|uniref:uncharacterized protein n=1 Tax=Penicillium antarcticum TaxID=416450 RepID=UPI00238AAE58|nr:uncharacterized protein N7508_007638 [Penicillium antarcticum]KAJ5297389.1 hypothetical protein N7508_007638 [Penicillium antarcticum]